jgi:alanyl aminopeptidase
MARLTVPVALACSLAAFAADQPPQLRLAEVQKISPERYRVELTLDPDKAEFTGYIRIQVKVDQPVQTIWLNANRITVREASVTAAGKTIAAKTLPGGDDFLGLQLPSVLAAGTAEIAIRYTGAVRHGDSSGVFQAVDGGVNYILTQFEATDARDAFPCFDEPSYKSPWQITLQIPRQDKAVSNTPAVSETGGADMKTVVFAETKPLPSYLIAFGVGPFEFVDAGVAGKKRVPVRIVTPKGRAAEAKYAAEVTATILTRLEDYFGIPFPYEKSDQVAVPVGAGFGAMENPGMVTYGQNILLARPESDSISRQRSYVSVAAHELSHQWFGDLVTTNWWNDTWLNEAFATWMQQKLISEWKPEWNTRVDNTASKIFAARLDSLVTARKIRQEIETKGDISNAFDGITYEKGAAVIGMFESWMGPEAFRKGVQSYLRRYAFRTATTGDFLDALSSSDKKDITRPFSTFLEQAGVPVVKVALDCSNAPTLHLEQSRYLPTGSTGSTNQVWSIPVCVRFGSGKGESQCALMTQPRMDLRLETRTCPKWIDANDNVRGYYRVDYQGTLLAALTEGDVEHRLTAAGRYDLLGNAEAMARGGRMPAADALRLVEAFRGDSSRQVLLQSLSLALTFQPDVVPESLLPNYQRFLRQNFQARAQDLGWIPKPGDSDDIGLLRRELVSAMAKFGGDRELALQARQLAEKWLADRKAVSSDVAGALLLAAAYHGDVALFQSFLAEYKRTQDRLDKQRLMNAMAGFRDPAAVEAGLREVLAGTVKLADGFQLLFGGQASPAARKIPFEFIKAHFDELMKDNPSIFGFSLGAELPQVGSSFCDAESRKQLSDFFTPLTAKYDGAPRKLAQVLESVDLCIARVAAQRAGVSEFLAKY